MKPKNHFSRYFAEIGYKKDHLLSPSQVEKVFVSMVRDFVTSKLDRDSFSYMANELYYEGAKPFELERDIPHIAGLISDASELSYLATHLNESDNQMIYANILRKLKLFSDQQS